MSLEQLLPVLQLSIGPVILISGVGLVLLSMTNRFGRVIDRGRILSAVLREGPRAEEEALVRAQLPILARRATVLRTAIILASLSLLLAAVMIIVIFLAEWFRLELALAIALLFVAGMLALIGGLVAFLVDINLSLRAFTLDLHGQNAPGNR